MEENLPLEDDGPHEHKLSLGTCDSPACAGASLPRSKWKVAGSSVKSGTAETAKLPKATSGHPSMVLASRDSLERGYLEIKLGELGCPSDKEGEGQGWQTPCNGRDTSLWGRSILPRIPIAAPLRNTRPKVFQNTNPLSMWGQTGFHPCYLVRAPSCVSVSSYRWVLERTCKTSSKGWCVWTCRPPSCFKDCPWGPRRLINVSSCV